MAYETLKKYTSSVNAMTYAFHWQAKNSQGTPFFEKYTEILPPAVQLKQIVVLLT